MYGNKLSSLSSLSNRSINDSGGGMSGAGGLFSSLLNSNRSRSPDTSRIAEITRRSEPGSPNRPVKPEDTF